jgi:hypothetical protein
LKSLGTPGVLKMHSHNVDICEEAITRTLYRLSLAGALLNPFLIGSFQPVRLAAFAKKRLHNVSPSLLNQSGGAGF